MMLTMHLDKTDMYRHVARRHLELAQLWRCPVSWCTVWKGTPQDFMDHIRDAHNVPGEIRKVSLEMLFPPWTVTRQLYAESLTAQHSNDVLLFSELGLSLVYHYRVHIMGQPPATFRGKYLAQLRALLTVSTILSTAGGPSGAACSPMPSMAGRTDGLGATPRLPGRRRRQGRIMDTPAQIAPRLTEQDPWMAAGAMVFDCRPALLPVSLDVSGIDMLAVRSSIPPAKTDVVPPEHEQQFSGADLLSFICPEFGVAPLLDPGTDLEDELPSPDTSPVVIGHGVALLPAQIEEDVDLAQVLAEFGTLPAIVTPIHDTQEERVVPPAECRTPEAHVDLLVAPAGLTVVPGDDVRPPTGSVGCSPIPLMTPAVPTPEKNLFFLGQPWVDPSSGGELTDYPLTSRPATVSQPVGELDAVRERVDVPDLSREGPFDIHRGHHHSGASPRLIDNQGCPFRMTSCDPEKGGPDFGVGTFT